MLCTLLFTQTNQGQHTYKTNRANASRVTTPLPPLRIDGPYGQLSIIPDDYPRLLLLGGGVGITPLTSTLRWLRDEVRTQFNCLTHPLLSPLPHQPNQ